MAKIIGTIDFETDPFQHDRKPKPFASCIYFNDTHNSVVWSNKKCVDHTVDILHELPECELYAHNGGKFDFIYLLPHVENQDLKIINGRIAKVKIANVTLIDSLLLIPFALEQYKKTKISYKLFEKNVRLKYKTKIVNYMIDDCRNLLSLLNVFHATIKKKLTIGSAAIQSMKDLGVILDRQNKKHDEIFREFYLGGRVQCFKRGHFKKKAVMIDINSAYNHAMLSDHPHGDRYKTSRKIFEKNGAWFGVITAVSRGALPVRNKYDLDFPDDDEERKYYATGHEILTGLKTNTLEIKKVHRIYIPEKTINFIPFVEYHYQKRLEASAVGDEIKKLVHKYCGNSGYGKLATNPEKFYDWVIADIGVNVENYEGGVGFKWYSDVCGKSFWRRKVSEEQKEKSYFDVATGASITGLVRSYLWQAINTVTTPYYCDTDGLICGHTNNLKLGTELGAWKTEMFINEMWIIGKKIYALSGTKNNKKFRKHACKGARLRFSDIKKIYEKGVVIWKNPAPTFSIHKGVEFIKRKISFNK